MVSILAKLQYLFRVVAVEKLRRATVTHLRYDRKIRNRNVLPSMVPVLYRYCCAGQITTLEDTYRRYITVGTYAEHTMLLKQSKGRYSTGT